MASLLRPRLGHWLGLGSLLFLVVLGLFLSLMTSSRQSGSYHPRTPTPKAVLQIERILHLTPLRVNVTDVLTAEGDGYRGAWFIKGDALLACDLAQAQFRDIDVEHRTATLELSLPQVLSARVDFERSRCWSLERTTWLPWSAGNRNDFQDAAMFHAQCLVKASAESKANLETARAQVETAVRRLYEPIGWDLRIHWRPDDPHPLSTTSLPTTE